MSLSSQAVSAFALAAQDRDVQSTSKTATRRTTAAKSDVVASPEAR